MNGQISSTLERRKLSYTASGLFIIGTIMFFLGSIMLYIVAKDDLKETLQDPNNNNDGFPF